MYERFLKQVADYDLHTLRGKTIGKEFRAQLLRTPSFQFEMTQADFDAALDCSDAYLIENAPFDLFSLATTRPDGVEIVAYVNLRSPLMGTPEFSFFESHQGAPFFAQLQDIPFVYKTFHLALEKINAPALKREYVYHPTLRKMGARVGQKLAPHIVIKSRPITISPDSGSQTGSVRSPHDRRSHFRTLKSGRVIRVKASAIHGGAEKGRRYDVGE